MGCFLTFICCGCVWLNSNHLTAAFVGHAFESCPTTLFVPSGGQTTVQCSGQGYRPVQMAPTSMSDTDECFTACIYAVDVHMDESLPPYSLLLSAMLL